MKLLPAVKYRFLDNMRGFFVLFAVVILVSLGLFLFLPHSNFLANGVALAIYALVLGINAVREDLRLFIQNGVSRRTTFLAMLVSAVLSFAVMAALMELELSVFQALPNSGAHFGDIFQAFYMPVDVHVLSLSQHVASALLNCSVMVFCFISGALLSLVFYRLNKFWTTIVAVCLPLALFAGVPALLHIPSVIDAVLPLLTVIGRWWAETVWNLCLTFAAAAVILALANFLLMRRAPIFPAKR